jgi:hypothetical protein
MLQTSISLSHDARYPWSQRDVVCYRYPALADSAVVVPPSPFGLDAALPLLPSMTRQSGRMTFKSYTYLMISIYTM